MNVSYEPQFANRSFTSFCRGVKQDITRRKGPCYNKSTIFISRASDSPAQNNISKGHTSLGSPSINDIYIKQGLSKVHRRYSLWPVSIDYSLGGEVRRKQVSTLSRQETVLRDGILQIGMFSFVLILKLSPFNFI